MTPNRSTILTSLAGLTVIFLLGAVAYAQWGENPPSLMEPQPLKVQAYSKEPLPAALRLTILETGIVAVTASQLRATNLRYAALSAANMRLTHDGEPVPFHVAEHDGDTAIYFYAEAVTNTLDAPAVYLLSLGEGVAMTTRDATPTGPGSAVALHRYHWEENATFLAHTTNDDVWLGPLIMAPRTWELALTELRPSGGPGLLSLQVWSNTQDDMNPDHHVEVALNGRSLANWYWDGITQETIDLPLAAGNLLPDQANVLTLTAPGDTGASGEGLYLDWVRLYYEAEITARAGQSWFRSSAANVQVDDAPADLLVFDVTNPDAPLVLQNVAWQANTAVFAGSGGSREYAILTPEQAIEPITSAAPVWATPLRQPDRQADYVAIVADVPGFDAALAPLLEHRRAQGYSVTAVPVAQVYDEFGHGHHSPDAIRSFLAYAASEWQAPAPRFVLLVGDASYDFLNHTANKNANLLPTSLVHLFNDGYVASDTWFTQFAAGAGPQLAVGRLPAQTAAQLEIMVNKTLAYETAPLENGWTGAALVVADDEPRFDLLSDDLTRLLADGGYAVHELRMSDNENVRFDIMSIINQGVGLVNYVGNGRELVWGDEEVFRSEDAGILTNQNRLPIYATFTCLNGAFAHPDIDTLAEALLWNRDGGVVAAIAPSGRAPFGIAQTTPLADAFYQTYLREDVLTLGDALLQAKALAARDPQTGDAIHLFNLLGDPALRVHKP
ncbi:MAG: hypothetical protein KC425_02625 [Anaerolineales bacterium]|nr:hypothetical protein [Anaerolineales bacterium]